MSDSIKLENERNQQEMRIRCIDYATRVVGKPEYLNIDVKWEKQQEDAAFLICHQYLNPDGKLKKKQQEDVVEVANKIYEFVIGF